MTQPCPRQQEVGGCMSASSWREDHTCSYCGSISPEEFFRAVEAGAEVQPTDKNYKCYVQDPEPCAGEPCTYATTSHQPLDAAQLGWVEVTEENRATLPPGPTGNRDWKVGWWVKPSTRSPHRTRKFYFQHLSEADRQRFIELFNSGKMNVWSKRFYVLPFFAQRNENLPCGKPGDGTGL